MAFIDYGKAFPSVETSAVLKAFRRQGIEELYVNILKHFYKEKITTTRKYQYKKFVRQWDTIYPKLFAMVSEEVL